MHGRHLPASRTDRFARPLGTEWIEHEDHVVLDTPSSRGTWSGHSLVLDEPPDDLGRWRARWHEVHGDKPVDRAMIAWESRERHAVQIPDSADHYRLTVLMYDQVMDARPGPARTELLAHADREDLVALAAATGDGYDSMKWAIDGWIARAAADQGELWGARIDGALVGVTGLFFDNREARTQWIATHPDHRRKGVCTQLLTQAVFHHQDNRPGIVYTVTETDSHADRLYRALDWRQVTVLDEVIFPPHAVV